ncbi:TadE/TadG family type IV pilus assembly protein [Mesorhizobium sangaii]|uniref:Flp pilus assembly protein TadG n=1 Tax=Mesorhizobium sangaii TaxID=505389 RepID=A0A841PG38_9HYPH|nr:TadE/TadG family type IV pilus assembly protein [Mesorhizobium sangaii]MBB6409770.1 Flp pilus assembly protein TadG [Mesorhizobium sangaii]
MRGLAGRFVRSRSGSFTPILIFAMMPIIAAIGFSVDYTSAVQTRSDMQSALDAGILSITTMDTSSTLAQRQVVLQDSFAANGAPTGATATLNSFVVDAGGTATAQATANYSMPTVFMQIARINTVPVAVASAVSKKPALVTSTFKVTGVSGYWNKTMTLYGTQFGATVAKPLMTIDYVYGGGTDPKGYGTTTVSTINNLGVSTVVQTQVCKVGKKPPSGVTLNTDQYGTKYYCVDTMIPANSAGAAIDVSLMGGLNLQMYVQQGNPQNLSTNDATTSNRLYIDGTEVPNGTIVDIFSAVPCGQPSTQAWEDGGNPVPAPVSNADFSYSVTGKCDFNKRPSNTVLTQ